MLAPRAQLASWSRLLNWTHHRIQQNLRVLATSSSKPWLATARLAIRRRLILRRPTSKPGNDSTHPTVSGSRSRFTTSPTCSFNEASTRRSLALHQDGLNTRVQALAPGDPDIADSLERLATTQMRMERYDEARQNLDRAHAIRVTLASQEPLGLAHTQELIAWLHRYAGDYPAAKAPLTAALGARRRLAPDHPGLVTTIEVQGDLLMLEGDITSAARSWQEALALAERTLGRDHPVISALERRLALSANAVGNRAEGRQRLEHALRIAERTRAPCDPELIVLINDSAGSLVFDGEYVEARTRFARTLELSQRCFGPSNSNTATVVFNLAALTAQMGDFTEAERLYERAIEAWSAGSGVCLQDDPGTGARTIARDRNTIRRTVTVLRRGCPIPEHRARRARRAHARPE